MDDVPPVIVVSLAREREVLRDALQRVLDWMDHGNPADTVSVAQQIQAALDYGKGGV